MRVAAEQKEITIKVPDSMGGFVNYFETHHSMDNLDTATWVRWGIIVLCALAVIFWHTRQNQSFHEYINNTKKRTAISDRLSQLAYNRSFEIFALFVVLIAGIIFYDTRINSQEQRLDILQEENLILQAEVGDYEQLMVLKEAKLQEALQLSGFDEAQQQELDRLKREFEGLFVNYYVLKKCNLNTTQDFHIMNSALMYRLNTLNAPSGIRQNILDAANGSYQELYSQQSCTDEKLTAMQDTIRTYLREVVENLPDS